MWNPFLVPMQDSHKHVDLVYTVEKYPPCGHVPGVDNVFADFLSGNMADQREWGLHNQVVYTLFKIWGKPQVDLFVSVHNHKLAQYCSLYPSPATMAQDAFSLN